jgi:hypothetical protein
LYAAALWGLHGDVLEECIVTCKHCRMPKACQLRECRLTPVLQCNSVHLLTVAPDAQARCQCCSTAHPGRSAHQDTQFPATVKRQATRLVAPNIERALTAANILPCCALAALLPHAAPHCRLQASLLPTVPHTALTVLLVTTPTTPRAWTPVAKRWGTAGRPSPCCQQGAQQVSMVVTQTAKDG